MALNTPDQQRSICFEPYIKDHLTSDAAAVLNVALGVKIGSDNRFPTTTSEHLIVGFNRSYDALARLGKYGIPQQGIQSLVETQVFLHNLPGAREQSVEGFPESTLYRTIAGTAALLAHQEQGLEYKIGPRHLVEAVRRFPHSRAYQILGVMASDTNF